MTKLWVVEAQFMGGSWGVCNFAGIMYAGTDFHKVHSYKRQIQKYLKKHNRHWIKRRIRVKEYTCIEYL